MMYSVSLSPGIIRAPPLYRMVNAGSCDYKKKKKNFEKIEETTKILPLKVRILPQKSIVQ